MTNQEIIDAFHLLYYDEEHRSPIINNTRWMGVTVQKCPLDLWIYQEIMFEVQPLLIIETGTLYGGSALWFADMMLILHGDRPDMNQPLWRVMSIDIRLPRKPKVPGITFHMGSSTSQPIIEEARAFAERYSPCMVILDSDHRAEHVYKELDIYSQFVTPGSYMIVEDGDANGHPILPRHGPGPWEAVHDWLPKHPEFEIDKSREKFLMTCNPDGYLRRKT